MEFKSVDEKVIFDKLVSFSKDNMVNNLGMSMSLNQDNDKNLINENVDQYFNEIFRNINTLENTRVNTSNRFISSRKGKIGVFLKRAIRKFLRWYIEPICVQQTEFNNAVTPTIGRMTELHKQHILNSDMLSKRVADLDNGIQVDLNLLSSKFQSNIDAINTEFKSNIDSINTELEQFSTIKSDVNNLYEYVNKQLDDINKKVEFISQIVDTNSNKLDKLNKSNPDLFEDTSMTIWDKRTTSQSGEDAIIAYILMVLDIPIEKCRYLDLGANHAKELSNTYYLYSNGARGVLVEANPQLIPELKFYRHKDIILNKCIDIKSNEYVDFYVLNGDGLSTPDKKAAEEFISKNPNLEIVETIKVETITIEDIFTKYFDGAPTILNVDIEGKELEIVKTIDFDNYRPLIIVVEMIEYDTTLSIGKKNSEILDFMESKDYVEYAFTGINSIFLDKKKLSEEK